MGLFEEEVLILLLACCALLSAVTCLSVRYRCASIAPGFKFNVRRIIALS
jgi:hypothetical protein